MCLYASRRNLEKERLLGLISTEVYYMLKIKEAALNYDVYEQKRLIDLRNLERRIEKQKAEEEKQRLKQEQEKAQKEQEKAIKEAIEKELPAKIEKELGKQIENALKR